MKQNIYQFNDSIDYLRSVLAGRKELNGRFSLRGWARQLQLKHPATLSAILHRKQDLNLNLVKRIAENLQLSAKEAEYFALLTMYTNTKSQGEKLVIAKLIGAARPNKTFNTLEIDILRAISDWRKMALLEMIESPTMLADYKNVSRRLGGQFDAQEIEETIDTFIRLGLVRRLDDGCLQRTHKNITACGDIPNTELRNLQKQYLQRALAALDSQEVGAREISTNVFLAKRDSIELAKAKLREFRRELAGILETKDGDTVYALSMAYFELLEK